MTRETKIGLIVAASFLCLVGIVVASKWRRGDDSKEPETQEIYAHAPAKEKQPEPKAPEVPKKSEAKGNDKGAPQPLPPLSVGNPNAKGDPIKDQLQKQMDLVTPFPALPALPAPEPQKPNPLDIGKPVAKDVVVPMPPIVPVGDPAPIQFKPFDPSPQKNPPIVTIPMPENPKPAFGSADPMPLPIPALPKDPAPMAKDPVPSFPPIAKDPVPSFPPLQKDPLPVAKDPIIVAPPPRDPVPAFPPLQKDPAPIAKDPVPSFPPMQKDPTPVIPKDNVSPLPPIVVGGNKAPLPQVRDTALNEYPISTDDRNFGIISLRVYGNEKYADALLAYNRTHSAIVPNGSDLKVDPPILRVGQKVLYPPKDVLERDYRQLIRETPVIPPTVAPAVKLTTPGPLNPTPAIQPVTSPPVAAGTYRVQNPNGESILDIAERTLGNRSRWTAIYDLNRSNSAVQPQFRIPAGTELKLPAN